MRVRPSSKWSRAGLPHGGLSRFLPAGPAPSLRRRHRAGITAAAATTGKARVCRACRWARARGLGTEAYTYRGGRVVFFATGCHAPAGLEEPPESSTTRWPRSSGTRWRTSTAPTRRRPSRRKSSCGRSSSLASGGKRHRHAIFGSVEEAALTRWGRRPSRARSPAIVRSGGIAPPDFEARWCSQLQGATATAAFAATVASGGIP